MAGEPALEKILDGLKAALLASPALAAMTIEIDRDADEDYGNAELAAGAINIIHLRTAYWMHEAGIQGHTAVVDLDKLVTVQAAAENAARLRRMDADIVAALWADRTLGGLAQDIRPLSTGGDDDMRADAAAQPLSIEILFLTPVGDHFTILGANGPVP